MPAKSGFACWFKGVADYAIYMLSVDGNITNWNAGAARINGYAANEVIGTHFARFYTPEEQQLGTPQKALQAAADVGRYENEGWRVRKDGSRFWANVVIDAIHDETAAIGFAKITRDSERTADRRRTTTPIAKD